MSTALIIEPEQEYFDQVKSSIETVDKSIECIRFNSLEEFYDWLKLLNKRIEINEKNLPLDDFDKDIRRFELPESVSLMIADFDIFKKVKTSLLLKTQKYFVSKGLAEKENPTRFLILAYENSDFDIEDYFHPVISCVLFKPFDAFILKQSLSNAFQGYALVKGETYAQEIHSNVDIVKRVELSRLTELGFRTYSTREIPSGDIAKYYGEIFQGQKIDFLYAKCQHSDLTDGKAKPFECSFSFFGMELAQLRTVRQTIHKKEGRVVMLFDEGIKPSDTEYVYVFTGDMERFLSIKSLLTERFENVDAIQIKNFNQLLSSLGSHQQKDLNLNPYVRIFTEDVEHEMILSDDLKKVIDIKSEKSNKESFLNLNFEGDEVIKISDICNLFEGESRKDWQSILDKKSIDKDVILEIKTEDEQLSLLEPLSIEEQIDPNEGVVWSIKVSELSESDINTHFSKKGFSDKKISGVIIDEFYFTEQRVQSIQNISKLASGIEDIKVFGISKKALTQYENWDWAYSFSDYFTLPLDSFYFIRKLKQAYPQWKSKEPLSREAIKVEDHIFAAISVVAEEISETFITILYHRAIAPGELREFIFHSEGYQNIPILGYCNYNEKVDKESFRLQFIFFGLRDRQRKYIRRWMKSEYLQAKKK